MSYFKPNHPRHRAALFAWMATCFMDGRPHTAKASYLWVLKG